MKQTKIYQDGPTQPDGNFKGIFYGVDCDKKYFEGGAHFSYKDLYQRLDKISQEQNSSFIELNKALQRNSRNTQNFNQSNTVEVLVNYNKNSKINDKFSFKADRKEIDLVKYDEIIKEEEKTSKLIQDKLSEIKQPYENTFKSRNVGDGIDANNNNRLSVKEFNHPNILTNEVESGSVGKYSKKVVSKDQYNYNKKVYTTINQVSGNRSDNRSCERVENSQKNLDLKYDSKIEKPKHVDYIDYLNDFKESKMDKIEPNKQSYNFNNFNSNIDFNSITANKNSFLQQSKPPIQLTQAVQINSKKNINLGLDFKSKLDKSKYSTISDISNRNNSVKEIKKEESFQSNLNFNNKQIANSRPKPTLMSKLETNFNKNLNKLLNSQEMATKSNRQFNSDRSPVNVASDLTATMEKLKYLNDYVAKMNNNDIQNSQFNLNNHYNENSQNNKNILTDSKLNSLNTKLDFNSKRNLSSNYNSKENYKFSVNSEEEKISIQQFSTNDTKANYLSSKGEQSSIKSKAKLQHIDEKINFIIHKINQLCPVDQKKEIKNELPINKTSTTYVYSNKTKSVNYNEEKNKEQELSLGKTERNEFGRDYTLNFNNSNQNNKRFEFSNSVGKNTNCNNVDSKQTKSPILNEIPKSRNPVQSSNTISKIPQSDSLSYNTKINRNLNTNIMQNKLFSTVKYANNSKEKQQIKITPQFNKKNFVPKASKTVAQIPTPQVKSNSTIKNNNSQHKNLKPQPSNITTTTIANNRINIANKTKSQNIQYIKVQGFKPILLPQHQKNKSVVHLQDNHGSKIFK